MQTSVDKILASCKRLKNLKSYDFAAYANIQDVVTLQFSPRKADEIKNDLYRECAKKLLELPKFKDTVEDSITLVFGKLHFSPSTTVLLQVKRGPKYIKNREWDSISVPGLLVKNMIKSYNLKVTAEQPTFNFSSKKTYSLFLEPLDVFLYQRAHQTSGLWVL